MPHMPLLNQTPNSKKVKDDLALAHRLAAHLGLDDTIFTHLSCRCPQTPDRFYLTPFGHLFEEVTAENLLTLSLSGEVISKTPASPKTTDSAVSNGPVNPAGSLIHSALYEARADIQCVIHLHSPAAMAVSCLEEGLLPLTQFALIFYKRLGYHTFEGISLDAGEKQGLVASLGPHKAMLLRNHGLITVAESLPQAFMSAYYLERSCAIQLKAQATGRPLVFPSAEVCEKTAQQFEGPEYMSRTLAWDALLRRL